MAEVEEGVCPFSTRELVDRIVLFIEKFTGIELYTYQSLFARRVVESLLEQDGAIITGLWARQSGKTETIADIVVSLALLLPSLANSFPMDRRLSTFQKGFWAGIYAPIHDQAQIAYGRMRQKVTSEWGEAFMTDPELGISIITNRGNMMTFSNGSKIASHSASPDTNIEGQTWHLVVCEESQKLSRQKVDKEIRPMLTSTNGTMIKIGTAWESRGGFHVSIQQNIDEHKKGGVRNHYEFPWKIVVAEKRRMFEKTKLSFHLNWEKFVHAERKRLGERSPEFRMNYECEWLESRIIAISPTTFRAGGITSLEAGLRSGSFQVAGLDIGKTNDSTVLTVMEVDRSSPIRNTYVLPESDEDKQNYYVKTIVDWLELGGPFEGRAGQYAELVSYLSQTSVQILVIDATAMGDPVFERIEAMIGGTVVCVPYVFGWIAKSHLYKYYLQEMNAGRVRYAAGPRTRERIEYDRFVNEHLSLDRESRGSYVLCHAPEGEHDDYPDSAALAAWGEKVMDEVIMPEISSSGGSGRGLLGPSTMEGGGRGSRYGSRRYG